MGWLFKSEDQKWTEAKQRAHQTRSANGQRVNKRAKTYTAAQQIADQDRIEKTKKPWYNR